MNQSSKCRRCAPAAVSLTLTLAWAAAPARAQDGAASPQDQAGEQTSTAAQHPQSSAEKQSESRRKKADELQAILVTGIRASIENSLLLDKLSNEITETVSAEDLGKLPSPSIAQSLGRLPGVMADRGADGFSDQISIRGMSTDFVGTLINGRVQATTGENWGVSFNQIPAALVSGATVHLTPNAELIGQGLTGTIDVHTVKPLDYPSRKLSIAAEGDHLTQGQLNRGVGVTDNGGRVSATYIDQFFDHTLGIAVGGEHSDTPIQQQTYQSWWWSVDNGPAGINTNWGGPTTPGMPDGLVSQEGMQLRASSEDVKRDAVMSIVEWAPSSSYHSSLDLFFSRTDKARYLNGLQWSSNPWDGVSYGNVASSPAQPYPIATSGTLYGVKPIMQNENTSKRYDLFSAGWKNRIELADQWQVKGELAYSRATENLHDSYTFTGLPNGGPLDTQFTIPGVWGFPTFTPSVNLAGPANVAFTDPDNYGYNGRVEFDDQVDRVFAARLEVAHPVGWIFPKAHVGIYYGDREKTKHAYVWFAFLNGNGSGGGTYQNQFSTPIGQGALLPSTSLAYGGIPGIVNYDVLQALASQFYLVPQNSQGDYDRNYSVKLKTPTAFVMLDIDAAPFGIPVRGNVGGQFIHTQQSSTALQTNGNALVGSLSGGTSYNEFLPSLNLVANLGHENYLRFGAAKEMVYGLIDDLRASASASVSRLTSGPGAGQVVWSGNGGNPGLRPYIAVGTDLAWTKYFGGTTFVELDAFNKDLRNYIYTQTVLNYDFSGYTNDNPSLTPSSNIGSFSMPVNGTGGRMYGGTISAGLSAGRISHYLEGFGIDGNYTAVESHIPDSTISNIPGGPQTLPGLSRRSGSLTVYYERGGFSARVAGVYRSDYTGQAVALFDQIGYTKIMSYTEADFQANYSFDQGRLKGLTMLFGLSNLTDEPYRTQQISGLPNGVQIHAPLDYNTWGRTITLGFRYVPW